MKNVCLVLSILAVAAACGADVRQPAVAGSFYPGGTEELRAQVEGLLQAVPAGDAAAAPVALVVPHAGYPYSGAVAARAFAALRGSEVERVIVLGPSHHSGFAGAALPAPSVTAWSTPLGQVEVDQKALAELRSQPGFDGPSAAQAPEHSLEVEVPFLQVVVPKARIVPIVVGPRTGAEQELQLAAAIAKLLGPGTVVVASSDFTHYGQAFGFAPFAARKDLAEALLDLGWQTAGRAAAVDPRGFRQQVQVSGDTVCGVRPVGVLLEILAHAFDGIGEVRQVTTSGHVSGSWDRVVTYAAVSWHGSWTTWREDEPAPALPELGTAQRQAVLELAHATLRTHLGHDSSLARWFAAEGDIGVLEAAAGAFVTLHNTGEQVRSHGRLRACMGIIEAREPLVDAVVHAAVSAAHDPRFPPLDLDELERLHLEVSVLSPTHRVPGFEAIVVGTHGVVLHKAGRSAVFLPQVAVEQGWDRDTMLTHLARKAGLDGDAWRQGAGFEVFTAQVMAEEE